MEESDLFELPVQYKGKEIIFTGRLATMGYTYKIIILVNEQEIIYEPDEEQNLRAIIDPATDGKGISQELAKAIGEVLIEHLK